MQRHSGFTLIELVVVIVILGILSAVAVPRFVDMQDEAAQASAEGLAGNLESAAAIDFAKSKVNNTVDYEFKNSNGATCNSTDFNNVLQTDLDKNASISGTYYDNCTLEYKGASVDFSIPADS